MFDAAPYNPVRLMVPKIRYWFLLQMRKMLFY